MVHIYVPMAHSKVVYSSKVLCLNFGMDDACYSTAARPPSKAAKGQRDIVEACYNTVSTSVTLQKKNVLRIDMYGLIGTQICRTFVLLLAKSRTFDYFIKPSYNAKD